MILILLLLSAIPTVAFAEGRSMTPYLDKLKQQIQEKDEAEIQAGRKKAPPAETGSVSPYIDSLQGKFPPAAGPSGSLTPYMDQLKARNPERYAKPEDGGSSYTERKKAELPRMEGDSAIAAVNEGRSALKLKRPGKITSAFGLRAGTAVSHGVAGSANVMANSFDTIYSNSGWVPDFTIFMERQLFHSETLGSFGVVGGVGATFWSGKGRFAVPLTNPRTGAAFTARTEYKFIAAPASIGANYRFNLTHYIRPFVQFSPTVIHFWENRNDGVEGHKGRSTAIQFNARAAILADWISPRSTWDLYDTYSVKHVYFTVEYTKLTTFASDVSFDYSGVLAGVTFEY